MIILYDLIRKYSFNKIYYNLTLLYPDLVGYSYAYGNVYQELLNTQPVPSQGIIHIEYVDEVDEPYHNVYHTIGLDRFAMGFVPWNEVLGMEVDLTGYTYEQGLAHILWEITFYGYSNAEVQEAYNALSSDLS